MGAPEGPDPLPFLPGQPSAAWPPKHASQVVAVQPLASGPGRSASPTMAPTRVVVLSCLSSGCSQLLTASQGTSWVVGMAGKSKVDQSRPEVGILGLGRGVSIKSERISQQ